MVSTTLKGFYRWCLITLVAVYVLIMVGGVVRSTGSGMGCPDWPKCFGSWVPPTSVEQLPSDYKEGYASYRQRKNLKFAQYLRLVGMNATADRLVNDKSILEETDFNPVKTWIEYVNRLVGMVVGIFVVILFYLSVSFLKGKPMLFWLSLTILLLIILQGWFGSIVVSTNLTRWTITTHLFLALGIIGLLVFLVHKTHEAQKIDSNISRNLLLICILALLLQIFFGTEVRGAIDVLSANFPRTRWISGLGEAFVVHRSFSWIIFFLNAALFYQTRKTIVAKVSSRVLFLLILCSLVTGAGMAYFNVPAALQPIHLLLATITFGVELFLFFELNKRVV